VYASARLSCQRVLYQQLLWCVALTFDVQQQHNNACEWGALGGGAALAYAPAFNVLCAVCCPTVGLKGLVTLTAAFSAISDQALTMNNNLVYAVG
jgi:hypothetical protein